MDIPAPILVGLEDPEAPEGWKQNQLQSEPQPALPGPVYTGKGSSKESESGTL